MTEIALNRKQLEKLFEITRHFHEVEWFTVETDDTSGIGTGIVVKFNAFGDADKDIDTTVNITDVSTW
jgi:uncharacterized membrane protein